MWTSAPKTKDIAHMMRRGIIAFFIFKHAMFERGLDIQNPTTMKPKIGATVPKITWDQKMKAEGKESPLSPANPLPNDGIITIKVPMICNIRAKTVK
jgi:hypothetical protein